MRNLIKILILCLAFIFSCGLFVFAEDAPDEIVENKDISVVIDAKALKTDHVIITREGKALLPLRCILTNLGVPNDNEHIIWNGKEESVTVYKENLKLYMKINHQKVYINDNTVTLDMLPVLYKDRTYVPASLISESLGKKLVWDNETRSIFITDKNEFEQVKEILENSVSKMNATKGYIMKYTLNDPNEHSNGNYTIELKVNTAQGVIYAKSKNDTDNTGEEFICTGKKIYQKDSDENEPEWTADNLDEESEGHFSEFLQIENFISKINDAFIAGMKKIKDDDNIQEIVLSGRVYPINIPSKADMFPLSEQFNIDDFKTTIIIDKKTGFVRKLLFQIYSNTEIGPLEAVSSTSEFSFPEEEIEIELPEVKD